MGILVSLLNFAGIAFFNIRENNALGVQLFFFIATLLFLFYLVVREKGTYPWLNKIDYILALGWLTTGFPWMVIPFLLLSWLYQASVAKKTIRFSQDKIILPFLFRRTIRWDVLNNVILKDDLLTLDFKNNKLIQQLIIPSGNPVSESEFNAFCRERLTGTSSFTA